MKKIIYLSLSLLFCNAILAQEKSSTPKPKIDLSGRPNDHLMMQFGYAQWTGVPDTIAMGGFSKTINVYVMMDFPFKNNPKLSVGIGAGIGSDHLMFSKLNVGLKDGGNKLPFTNVRDTNHFKKTKLATNYVEAPIELRYSAQPATGKGLKVALGIKVGQLINVHTRSAKLQNRNENLINDYVVKESSSRFINGTRLSGTLRVGIGRFSMFTSYQLTPVIRDGFGPAVRTLSTGIAISGL
ncbi:MAG: outer membrane beta-barrel protein [Sphingomonadales bacterium]